MSDKLPPPPPIDGASLDPANLLLDYFTNSNVPESEGKNLIYFHEQIHALEDKLATSDNSEPLKSLKEIQESWEVYIGTKYGIDGIIQVVNTIKKQYRAPAQALIAFALKDFVDFLSTENAEKFRGIDSFEDYFDEKNEKLLNPPPREQTNIVVDKLKNYAKNGNRSAFIRLLQHYEDRDLVTKSMNYDNGDSLLRCFIHVEKVKQLMDSLVVPKQLAEKKIESFLNSLKEAFDKKSQRETQLTLNAKEKINQINEFLMNRPPPAEQEQLEEKLEKQDGPPKLKSQFSFDSYLEKETSTPVADNRQDGKIDIEKLLKIISEGSEEIEKLKGKSVTIIMGKTGVGKSTFVQLLGGAKATSLFEDNVKTYHLSENELLKDFKIGHENKSCTKVVKIYVCKHNDTELYFVDLPGYKDTNDHHIDIATSVWISQIAQICGSLRFAILCHSATLQEEYGTPFKELLQMFTDLVSNRFLDRQNSGELNSNVRKSLLFLFTHMSVGEEEIEEKVSMIRLRRQMAEILEIVDKENGREYDMMEYLVNQIEPSGEHSEMLRVLNPVTTKIESFKDFLIKSTGIRDPPSIIKFALVGDVNKSLNFSLMHLKTTMKECLSSRDPEVQKDIPRLFDLLHSFKILLKSQFAEDIFNKSLETLQSKSSECLDSILKATDGITGKEKETSRLIKQYRIYSETVRKYEKYLSLPSDQVRFEGLESLHRDISVKVCLLRANILSRIHFQYDGASLQNQLENLFELSSLKDEIADLGECVAVEYSNGDYLEIDVMKINDQFAFESEDYGYIYEEILERSGAKGQIAPLEKEHLEEIKREVIIGIAAMDTGDIVRYAVHYYRKLAEQIERFLEYNLYDFSTHKLQTFLSGVEKIISVADLKAEKVKLFKMEKVKTYDKRFTRKVANMFKDLPDKICNVTDDEEKVANRNMVSEYGKQRDELVGNHALAALFPESIGLFHDIERNIEERVKEACDSIAQEINEICTRELHGKYDKELKSSYFSLLHIKEIVRGSVVSGSEYSNQTYDKCVDKIGRLILKIDGIIQHELNLDAFSFNSNYLQDLKSEHREEVIKLLIEKAYVDELGCFCEANQEPLSLGDALQCNESDHFVTIFNNERTLALKTIPKYDVTKLQCVLHLRKLRWLSELYSGVHMERLESALDRAREVYRFRSKIIQFFIQSIDTSKAVKDQDHSQIASYIRELGKLKEVRDIFPKLEVDGMISKLSEILEHVCQLVTTKCDGIATSGGNYEVSMVDTNRYPYSDADDLLRALKSYEDLGIYQDTFSEIISVAMQRIKRPLEHCIEHKLKREDLKWNDLDVEQLEVLGRCDLILKDSYLKEFVPSLLRLRDEVSRGLKELDQTIDAMVNAESKFDEAQEKLKLYEQYKPLSTENCNWMDINIDGRCSHWSAQIALMSTSVSSELDKSLKEFSFGGGAVRSSLDYWCDKSNNVLFTRYTKFMDNLMNLLEARIKALKSCILSFDGKQYREGIKELTSVCNDLCNPERDANMNDHVLIGSKEVGSKKEMNLANEIIDIETMMKNELEKRIHQAAIEKNCCTKIDKLNQLKFYIYDLDDLVPSTFQQDINKEIEGFFAYFEINDNSNIKKDTFQDGFQNFISDICTRTPPSKGFDATYLNNILNQLKEIVKLEGLFGSLQGVSTYYHDWTAYIQQEFVTVATVLKKEDGNGDSFSSLEVMNFMRVNAIDALGHLDMATKSRINGIREELEKQVKEYNDAFASNFGSDKACKILAKNVINSKKAYEDYKNRSPWFRDFRYLTREEKEIELNIKSYKNRWMDTRRTLAEKVKGEIDNAIKALTNNNFELFGRHYAGLFRAEKFLWEHIGWTASDKLDNMWHKLDVYISEKLRTLSKEVLDAIEADKASDQKCNEFFTFRIELAKLNIPLPTVKDLGTCIEIHNNLNTYLDTKKNDFEKKIMDSDFRGASELWMTIANLMSFTNLKACDFYFSNCKTCYVKKPYTTFYSTGERIEHHGSRSDYSESVRSMEKGIREFIKEDDISLIFGQALNSISNKTNDHLKHNEFENLGDILNNFLIMKSFATHVKPKNKVGGEIIDTEKIDALRLEIQNRIKGTLEALKHDLMELWEAGDWEKMNEKINILKNSTDHLRDHSGLVDENLISELHNLFDRKLSELGAKALEAAKDETLGEVERMRTFSLKLVAIGKIYASVNLFAVKAKEELRKVLNDCKEKYGFFFVFKLGLELDSDKSFEDVKDEEERAACHRIARKIVSEFSHFSDVATMSWNDAAVKLGVKTCISELKKNMYMINNHESGRRVDTKQVAFSEEHLERRWEIYKEHYEKLCEDYLQDYENRDYIVTKAHQVSASMKPCSTKSWNKVDKDKIPHLLAHIFAYFTIDKSGESYNSLMSHEPQHCESILMKPHPVQILTILHLLGCSEDPSKPGEHTTTLEQHLMEVRTGEGKSFILGALATVFGALGFNVRCVCYSEYLSTRDFNDFKVVFEKFGCIHSIHYSKITAFSESNIAEKGQIRSMTQDLIGGNLSTSTASTGTPTFAPPANESTPTFAPPANENGAGVEHRGKKETILLVDEVDVFFGKEFYGQTYNQVAHLQNDDITSLIRRIWNNKASKPSLYSIKSEAWEEYQRIKDTFAQWMDVIDVEIKLMCSQVTKYKDPEPHYNRHKDLIGYKDHDTISYDVKYGYRTVFAYLHQLEKGNVLTDHKRDFEKHHCTMQIVCGQFSYAEIDTDCILGVSGTLSALSDYEKRVISDFDIKVWSTSGSVYRGTNLTWDAAGTGIHVEVNLAHYFCKIADVINTYSRQDNRKHRPIIVFFENGTRLEEFRRSESYRNVKDNTAVHILTEATPSDSRDFYVKKAGSLGQVTLSTKIFGRGTDFISRDKDVKDLGGVHVLQTFLSESLSEEVQIKGRTARQGQKGSFSQVLLLEDAKIKKNNEEVYKKDTLQYFGLAGIDEYESWSLGGRRKKLHEMRMLKKEEQSIAIEEAVFEATERHRMSHEYFDALLNRDETNAKEYLIRNHGHFKKSEVQAIVQPLHFVFVLDQSTSMGNSTSKGTRYDELRTSFDAFKKKRLESGDAGDRVSVILFSDNMKHLAKMVAWNEVPALSFNGGGTKFEYGLRGAEEALARDSSGRYRPVIIFMTDGDNNGDQASTNTSMQTIDNKYKEKGLITRFIAFGGGADQSSLQSMAQLCTDGIVKANDIGDLEQTFLQIEAEVAAIPEY